MKFVIISDTHTMHKGLENRFNFPPADFLIHCGDITGRGTENTIREFLEWFNNLNQFKYKIFIAGNHDRLFEAVPQLTKEILNEYPNIIYLEDSGIELDGIKFWGSPVSKPFMNWAFNRPEEKLKKHWETIPNNIDVLITHSPPHKIMDYGVFSKEHTGSPSLFNEVINRIKPKIHCFGHIHNDYGMKIYGETKFINASNLNEDYKIVNPPIIIEI
jgi:Icc-related predicted phosphoesterase